MDLESILAYPIKSKNICIIGYPSSGKTHLSHLLADGHHKLVHTDSYIQYGYEASMYHALEECKNTIGHVICEGVQGYRLLRKSAELSCFKWDIVIECVISRARMEMNYINERNPSKIKYLKGFITANQKVLNDYLGIIGKNKPVFLEWENTYNDVTEKQDY
jgi:hypothetical protein